MKLVKCWQSVLDELSAEHQFGLSQLVEDLKQLSAFLQGVEQSRAYEGVRDKLQ